MKKLYQRPNIVVQRYLCEDVLNGSNQYDEKTGDTLRLWNGELWGTGE